MRFDLHYRTIFRYPEPVVESQNELRAAPTSDDHQNLIHYDVRTSPRSRSSFYMDYWGTRVDTFGVRGPHDHLEVVAEATVEVHPRPPLTASPVWAEVHDRDFADQYLEYLGRSAHADWGGGVTQAAREIVDRGGDDVVRCVHDLYRFVGTTLDYEPGSTYVGVDVDQVLAERRGVCQDFAHLLVALCRSVGVPARYASGYLFARGGADADEPEEDTIEVQTHAWAEVRLPGADWFALDPTNRRPVGERHIKIGHGRDYDDVAPLRGVYNGPAADALEVTVEMRRFTAAQQQQQ